MGFQPFGTFTGAVGSVTRDQFFRKPVVFYDKVTFEWATNRIVIEDGTIKGFDTIIGADFRSTNWDGTIPADLSSGPDTGATVGFYLDGSAGAAQFQSIFAEGGDITDLRVVGELLMGGGGIFRTAGGSSTRIQIDDTLANAINFYSGHASEASDGQATIQGPVALEPFQMSFSSANPDDVSANKSAILLISDVKATGVGGHIKLWPAAGGSTYSTEDFHVSADVDGTTGDPIMHLGPTSAAPAFTFLGDTNTGMVWGGVDQLAFSTGGAIRVRIGTSFLIVSSGALDDRDPRIQDTGTATAPAYAFRGDTNTGMFRNAADSVGFALGGVARWMMYSTAFVSISTTGAARINTTVGAVATPSYGFESDTNTGMYRVAADRVGLSAGGQLMFDVQEAGTSSSINFAGGGKGGQSHMPHGSGNFYFSPDDDESIFFRDYNGSAYVTRMVLSNGDDLQVLGAVRTGVQGESALTNGYFYHIPGTTGTASNMHTAVASGSTYYILRSTSSRRYKKHITYPDWIADIELKPASFWRDDDDDWQLGLIAEDLADADYRLATYEGLGGGIPGPEDKGDDGKGNSRGANPGVGVTTKEQLDMDTPPQPDNVQTNAVLAVLAAKINRLERLLTKELERDRIAKPTTQGGPNGPFAI